MAFDSGECDPGTGGLKFIGDSFTDTDAVVRFAPGTMLVYGADGGPYTRVNTSDGLPVAQQGTWNVGTVSAVTAITNALPAGANAIGKLAANSGVDIGDVDVTSVIPGSGATNLGKAEDAAHASGDVGVMALSVRQDTAAALGGLDADYQPLITDASGRLHVNVGNTVTVGSHAVTNAGTFAVQAAQSGTWNIANAGTFVTQIDGAALTALQLIDNIVLAEDAGHSSGDPGVAMFAVRNDSDASLCGTTLDYTPLQVDANGYLKVNIKAGAGSGGTASTDDAAFTAASGSGTPMMGFVTADSVDSGDVGVVGMLANRQLKVTLYDSAGSELAVGGGTQYTEDAAAAANPIGNSLILVRADALAALTTADGDNVAARGTDKGELYVKHADALTVNSHAVTNAGTFATQAEQSGTWNVTNVSGTISLPTGAATLVEQQTQTTAQAAIQTSVQLIDDAIVADDAAFTPATTKVMMAGFEFDDTTPDSVNEGDAGAARMSANRSVYVNIRDNAGNERGLNIDASGFLTANINGTVTVGSHAVTNAGTFAVQATVAAAATNIAKAEDDASANLDVGVPAMAVRKATPANTSGADGDYEFIQMSAGRLWVDPSGVTLTVASHAVTNAGTFAVQVDGSALASLQLIDDAVYSDDAAFTPATSKVLGIGLQADEASTDSVDEGDIGCPRMTLDRKQIMSIYAHAAGGATPGRLVSAATTNATSVKASAGTLYSVVVTNVNAAIRYLKFYNKASAPTVGTDTPVQTYGIPGNTAGAGIVIPIPACGIEFSTGIALAMTTEGTDAGTTAVAANEIILSYSYK